MIVELVAKPVTVYAVEWIGENVNEIAQFIGAEEDLGFNEEGVLQVWNYLERQWLNVPVGHFVIKGLKGEHYPCDPAVVQQKYDIRGL